MMAIPGKIYSQGGIMMSERKNGRWTAPRWAPFTGEVDGDVPFFCPTGTRVFFISTRSLPGQPESSKERIWYVERKGEGWGEAQVVDAAINNYPQHWQFSVDVDQTIYFSTSIPDGFGEGDIYCSRFVAGHWQVPVNLGPAVNSDKGEEMPFVSPDGGYLLFSRNLDLYISFRDEDGAWKKARKLDSPINSPGMEICPLVTPDGKYLLYLSTREDNRGVWWMKADFIDRLRN
jgi:dipeptidyl aminopeptidase/acylaminoacyl peptidase